MIIKRSFLLRYNIIVKYIYIDESGDNTFYSKYGKLIVWTNWCSSYLQLCMIITDNPKAIRQAINDAKKEVLQDTYLKWIPSIEKRRNRFVFHASEDVPEVREKLFKRLIWLQFESHTIVVHKDEAIFKSKHNNKPEVFYNTTVQELFEHAQDCMSDIWNIICFEKRWKKSKQIALTKSIEKAMHVAKVQYPFEVMIQMPSDEPCLQVSDYVNRAIQRTYTKNESRYVRFLQDKIHSIQNLYGDWSTFDRIEKAP